SSTLVILLRHTRRLDGLVERRHLILVLEAEQDGDLDKTGADGRGLLRQPRRFLLRCRRLFSQASRRGLVRRRRGTRALGLGLAALGLLRLLLGLLELGAVTGVQDGVDRVRTHALRIDEFRNEATADGALVEPVVAGLFEPVITTKDCLRGITRYRSTQRL